MTLIFSVARYEQVAEAYVSGLEDRVAAGETDLRGIASVASFFVSRTDTEVDRRLDAVGTQSALALRGRTAVAQAQAAYGRFAEIFGGPRWEALEARGAQCQRPLWASTSTKNPAYPDTLYVDELIGPRTVNTMPDDTLAAFCDHGKLRRTVDADQSAARYVPRCRDLARHRPRRRRRDARGTRRGGVLQELRRAARLASVQG